MTELERMAIDILDKSTSKIITDVLSSDGYIGHDVGDNAIRLAIMTALTKSPPGWKLVPIDPSEQMIDAATPMHTCEQGDSWYANHDISEFDVAEIWKAMLAAAPEYKEDA